jgi:DNA modification methylase
LVQKNTKTNLLGKEKKFAAKDTSYSSFWLYNREADMNSEHFKDSFVNFYDEKILLSEFNPTVAKNVISFWSNPGDRILDPFAGRTRALVSHCMGREYIGYEVSKDVCDYMNNRIDELQLEMSEGNYISIINDDCRNIKKTFTTEYFDLVFTCPPYWNLEKYESCEGQLSDIDDYIQFLLALGERLVQATKVLRKDGYMCVVIGDFRKRGKYIKIHSDLMQLLETNPLIKLYDVVIIQNIPFHSAAYYFGGRKKHKYTAKAHEYLLVYKKK